MLTFGGHDVNPSGATVFVHNLDTGDIHRRQCFCDFAGISRLHLINLKICALASSRQRISIRSFINIQRFNDCRYQFMLLGRTRHQQAV